MDQEETLKRTTIGVDALRGVLKSQYHAALAMLRDAIDLCPSDAWYGDGHGNAPWQIAYHLSCRNGYTLSALHAPTCGVYLGGNAKLHLPAST